MSGNNRIRYNKETSLGMLTGTIFTLLKQELQRQFDARDIPIKVEVFAVINRLMQEDEVSQQTVAGWFNYDRPRTSRVIDELEKVGLVVRKEHPKSRRTKLVCLSEYTKRNKPKIIDALESAFEIAYDGFSKEEINITIKNLRKIKENLEQ